MGVSENGAPTPKMAKWWYPLDFGYPIFEHIQTVVFLAGLLVSVSQIVAWPSSRCCMLLAWGTYETLMNLFEAKVRSCRWGKMLRPLSGFNWSSLEGSKRWVFWFSRGFLMHWMTFGEPLWKMSPAGVHQFIYKQTIGSSFCGCLKMGIFWLKSPFEWGVFLDSAVERAKVQTCFQTETQLGPYCDSFPGNWSIFLMNPPQTQVCGQAEGGQRFQWAKCGWFKLSLGTLEMTRHGNLPDIKWFVSSFPHWTVAVSWGHPHWNGQNHRGLWFPKPLPSF